MADLDAHKLTWAALLGRWVEFARSAVALPPDAESQAWRTIVPDIIGLQAVTMALRDRDKLQPADLTLAIDRSRVLAERHAATIRATMPEPLHPMLAELIADTDAAIADAEAEA
ncbi:MAG: hypothetical protein GC159_21780 [Phycisphaera sp.]|nr:hypothetical protein [Phycisphaera sp.]